ncbi:MAG TPA: pyridoxamine 5'-phosphate oxidase [Longimicrobiales bacterium]|nr:pyridoxamine 5'-phosphate oxidase [Longimicrobiales bacterium]
MGLRSLFHALFTAGKGVVRGMDIELLEREAGNDPLVLFDRWFRDAREAGLYLAEAMTLATATPGAAPSARLVLLKSFGPDGFVFFTNYDSCKAAELDANPRASLVFHWATLHRQVRVSGPVERTTRAESEEYFRTRPRGSRIAAWASNQSGVLRDRAEIERRFREVEEEYAGTDVPLPPFWGGYRLRPESIEFWQGRVNRLHDRLVFTPDLRGGPGGWTVHRLSP